jgi:hypothetical protein
MAQPPEDGRARDIWKEGPLTSDLSSQITLVIE